MRTVGINGISFDIRGLRLSEINSAKMRRLGYGRFLFKPQIPDNSDDAERYLADCQDAALKSILTDEQYDAVDQAGGARALSEVFKAILSETYGNRDEEKNLPSAGSGNSTLSESSIAELAENTEKTNVETASTKIHQA